MPQEVTDTLTLINLDIQETTNMDSKPQGNYIQRVDNDINYRIDRKTGRAVKRSLFGQGVQMVNPLKYLGNIGSNTQSDILKQQAANGLQPQEQPQEQYPQYQNTPDQGYPQAPQGQDYSQGQGYSDYNSGSSESGMTNLQALFGPQIKTMDDLVALRSRLNEVRQRAAFGLKVTDKDFADAMDLDFGTSNPSQIDAVMRARSDMFDTPISKIDSYLQNAQSSSNNSGGAGLLGSLPNAYRDDIWKMRTEFENNPVIKDFKGLSPSYRFIADLDPKTASNSDAQTALIAFTKALDPNSVVREGELALTTQYANNPSLLNQLRQQYAKLIQGKAVRPEALTQIAAAFKGRYSAMQKEYQQIRQTYSGNASSLYGVDPATSNQLFNDYSATGSTGQQYQTVTAADGTVLYDLGNGQYSYSPPKASGAPSRPSQASTGDINDMARRLARIESSNNYRAVGPRVPTGMYRGQVALGKYQIMEGNVAPWARELLGMEVTPQQFYQNPQLQEKLARAKLQQLWNKYGNANDVASAWFTGGPLARNRNSKDVTGTTAQQYVNRFNA